MFTSPNFTQAPNDFFDKLLREIDDLSELKVTLAAIRQTFGFHRTQAKMSQSFIEKATGLSRNSVRRGIELAIQRGTLVEIEPATNTTPTVYAVPVNTSDPTSSDSAIRADPQPVTDRGSATDPQPLTPRNKELINKQDKESLSEPNRPQNNFDVSEKNRDDEGFAALLEDIQTRVTHFSPSQIENLSWIWDDYPDLDCHVHALEQTDKYAAGFNLTYYERCCSSWWAKHRKGHSNDEQNNATESRAVGHGQAGPTGGPNGPADRNVSPNTAQSAPGRASPALVLSGVRRSARAGPRGNSRD